jgi:hypothetical protein
MITFGFKNKKIKMKNLPTFDEFLNESKIHPEVFKDAIQKGLVVGINPDQPGVVRKNPSFRMSQGKFWENPYGKAELKKLVEEVFKVIKRKYKDAELLGPDPYPNRSFDWAIEFQGNLKHKQYIGFDNEEMTLTGLGSAGPNTRERQKGDGAPEFKQMLKGLDRFVEYKPNIMSNIGDDITSSINIGDIDRLLVHLDKVI